MGTDVQWTFRLAGIVAAILLLQITGCPKAGPAEYPEGWPVAMIPLPRGSTQIKLPPRERRFSGDDYYICGHRSDVSGREHYKRWVLAFRNDATWQDIILQFEQHLVLHDYLRLEDVPLPERCLRNTYGDLDEAYYISPDSMFRLAVVLVRMKKVGNNKEAYKGYMLEIRQYDTPTTESLDGTPLDRSPGGKVHTPF